MNETSATSTTSASGLSLLPDGIATLTAIHFAIIAVLAALAILGLVWGIRAKRSRTQASREQIVHAEEAGMAPEPSPSPDTAAPTRPVKVEAPVQAQTQAPVAPVPVVPPIDTAPEPIADEPVAPVAPPIASPASPPAPAPSPEEAKPGYADDPVTQLKGLGPKVAARLAELGVTTIGEMAALSDSDAQAIDTQLGNFTGRMHRDRWIEQARLLAAGDRAGFEAKFGKL